MTTEQTPQIESAWGRYPDYRIDLVPIPFLARAWYGDVLLAESDACIRLDEQDHADRLYFPEDDVDLDLFEPTDHHTVCPFKGQADYWTLTASEPPLENVLWTYRQPFQQVAGIQGYVCFYHEKVRVELVERWPDSDPRAVTVNQFPTWGDAADLVELIDVSPVGPDHFVGATYHDVTRNVVEGGQQLAEAVVAASKTIPDQRVVSAHMVFAKAATFDTPLEVELDVRRRGKTFSTVDARLEQDGQLRSSGTLLLDTGADDVFSLQLNMPEVPGPYESEPYDMRMTGRDLRIVQGAYSPDPDQVGPPEIFAWMRFRDDPGSPYLRQALLAQPMCHWTIAAAMRPIRGVGEAQAHVSLSTGPMALTVAFHDDVDVTGWLLYANAATRATRGMSFGEGRVFTEDGRMVASYTVQSMIRAFARDSAASGLDPQRAM
jgi:acyl-CoA thioesterase II